MIIALSLAGVIAGGIAAHYFGKRTPPLAPVFSPAANPYADGIYAQGIVESAQPHGTNVAMYPEVAGTVTAIPVVEGDRVRPGQTLLRLDDSVPKAAVEVAAAALRTAQDTSDKLHRAEAAAPGAVSKDALDTAANGVAQARANLDVQQALLKKYRLSAGQAGVVLSVNAAIGGYISSQGVYDAYTGATDPVLVLGAIPSTVHVRCFVDEILVHRLPAPAAMKAQMTVRGQPLTLPLRFVRVQPFVGPKIELSDQRTERVDVRVLPIIFSVDKPADVTLYPGELVDVYIGR